MSHFDNEPMLINNNSEETDAEAVAVHPHDNVRLGGYVLEPAVSLILFARCLIDAVYQNQILYQTCLQTLHYNSTQCEPFLGIDRSSEESKKIEVKVQEYAANIVMVSSLMESFFPAMVSLFLGPWSDKFGRRPVLLATFSGYLSSSIILIVITQISLSTNISPWWYILYSVPPIFSGGYCSLTTVAFCYISDVTTVKTRPMRMVMMDASLSVGMIGGSVTSGYIYELTTAAPLFMISGSLMGLSLFYFIFWVPESLKPEHIHTSHRLQEFIRMDLLKDLWQTCCQRRGNSESFIIWLTMLALTIHVFASEGENGVNLLFIREKFDWTVKDFSVFNVARLVIQIMGSILGLSVLRRFFKLSIHSIAILCLGCTVLESATRATAQYSYEIYMGLSLGMMRGVLGPIGKTILSQVTPSSEVGKIFALSSSLQAVTPSLAVPLYTSIYKSTVENYPGAFNLISLGLNFAGFILMNVVYCIQKSAE